MVWHTEQALKFFQIKHLLIIFPKMYLEKDNKVMLRLTYAAHTVISAQIQMMLRHGLLNLVDILWNKFGNVGKSHCNTL